MTDFWKSAWGGSSRAVAGVVNILPSELRGIGIAVFSYWACGPGAASCAAAVFAATTATVAYGNGASTSQALRTGLVAWGTAYAFSWAGDAYSTILGMGYIAHAGVGCVSSVANGANCGQGAASAVFGKFATAQSSAYRGARPGEFNIGHYITTSVAGGVGSVMAGGKFANGATTAAFGYLFNFCAHNGCFNRRFDWFDAMDQWRNGNGSTVTDVKASELNLTDAKYTKNEDGTYQIHTSLKFDTGAIYGTVTGDLNADGTMSIRPDTYNFDLKNPFKPGTMKDFGRLVQRNMLTVIGLGVNGFGTPYRIEFTGSITAPKDLPK